MRAIEALAHKTAHPNIGYPYYVSINGSSTFTPLICDSFDNSVKLNQTWRASALPFLQGIASSMFCSTMTLDYKAAGLIFKSMLARRISTNSAQWAIWGLFSTNASTSSYFISKNFGAIDATYLGLAATASNSVFNGLVLYTPTNGRPGIGPQEYIGYTVPEPGTLTLMGTGLIGLAGFIRRKLGDRKFPEPDCVCSPFWTRPPFGFFICIGVGRKNGRPSRARTIERR